MKNKQKHNKLIRRQNGNFAPLEVPFLGARSTYIEEVVIGLSKILSSKYKVTYLEASHIEEATITHLDSYIYNENEDLNILKNSKIYSHQTKIDFFQFLINSEIKKVFLDEKFITNINYKEEYLQTFKNIP